MKTRRILARTLFSGLFSFFFLSVSAVSADELVWRLKQFDEKNYLASVDFLKKQYADRYRLPSDYLQAARTLSSERTTLLDALKRNDVPTVERVEELFRRIDAALLANPAFKDKDILYTTRTLGKPARSAMGRQIGVGPSNFQNNSEIPNPKSGWDNHFSILRFDGSKIDRRTVYKPEGRNILSDPELHFDGRRLLYSSIGTNDRWHLFELDLTTTQPRQVTPETYRDFDSFDACYTPDDRIIFCSTGTFLGLPCTDGGNKMSGLFQFDPRTGKTRQLTFDQDSNWEPVVLPNGKIMYQRWEYADLPHSNSRIIFTMNPDGTEQKAYYGSNSYFPTALFGARPVPGKSSLFVGTVGGHHSVARSGRLMLFDTDKGRKEAEGVLGEYPYFGRPVFPIVRDRLPDGVWPHFLHPYPLDETYCLVVIKPTPTALWGLYLADRFNNISLVYQEENAALLNPIVVERRPTPPVIPDRINLKSNQATVFIQNIYMGDGLKGIPEGTVKKLRVGSYSFSPHGQGGLLGTIGMDGPWDLKQIEGTVDVEPDGSAMFTIPANTPIFLQPLDSEGKALQVMRSWFTGMPGETVSCIGCHEDQRTIPIPKAAIASKKKPQAIRQWYGKERGLSYEHEVQPVLDKYCVQCHDGTQSGRPYFKSDRKITNWTSRISGRAGGDIGGKFSESYGNLHRYVRRPGIESDMNMLVPMDVHANQTELMQLLNKGHHGVSLDRESIEKLSCWIDFNAPYFGRRQDIPESHNPKKTETVKRGMTLRQQYAQLFQVSDRHLSWLPDISKPVTPVSPLPSVPLKGEEKLEGWPIAKKESAQLPLGNFQKRIELSPGIVLQLIKVPTGTFLMGSDRQPDEQPVGIVRIDQPYWIGQFEITNSQYALFDPSHDSRDEHRHGYQFGRKGYPMNHPDQPVVRISWQQALDFCRWLSRKTGMNFTLPSEAQWEWACRAGSDNAYSFGNLTDNFTPFANFGDIRLREFAACTAYKNYESVRILDNPVRFDDWIPRDTLYNDGGFISEPVGRYRANVWDLYDMHGNVWEWTLSDYRPYPYRPDDGRNALSPQTDKVVRGGSWYDRPHKGTSSYRLPYRSYQKVYNVGFRVVCTEE